MYFGPRFQYDVNYAVSCRFAETFSLFLHRFEETFSLFFVIELIAVIKDTHRFYLLNSIRLSCSSPHADDYG